MTGKPKEPLGPLTFINLRTKKAQFFVRPAICMLVFCLLFTQFVPQANSNGMFSNGHNGRASHTVDSAFLNTYAGIQDNSGAYTYEYPLEIPPGRNGVQPELSLTYNSGNTSNVSQVGHGWTLSIPYIKQFNKTGVNNIYGDDNFESSLDGELSLITTGVYKPRSEGGAFNKYEYSNDKWTVTAKDGTVYKFGHSSSTRLAHPDVSTDIYVWMLEEIRDTNDNYVRYEYYKDDGQIYPDTIYYTGHGSTDGPFSVHFDREARNDVLTSYEARFEMTTNYRIDEIRTEMSGGSWMQKYELGYAEAENDRSLLSSIKKHGKDEVTGNPVDLPATTFDYSEITKSWTEDTSLDIPGRILRDDEDQIYEGVYLVDINSDALPDVIKSEGHGTLGYDTKHYGGDREVYINNGDGWDLNATWTLPLPEAPNGADIYFVMYRDPELGAYGNETGARFVDVNGDGYTDILWASEDEYTSIYPEDGGNIDYSIRKVFINNKIDGWDESTYYQMNDNIVFVGENKDQSSRILDFNGDSLPDFFRNHPGVTDRIYRNNGSTSQAWTAQSTSFGAWPLPEKMLNSSGQEQGVRFADVNGDGLVDVIRSDFVDDRTPDEGIQKVYINVGKGWEHDSSWTIPEYFASSQYSDDSDDAHHTRSVRLVDVNSDGLVDILKRTHNDLKVYLNNGSGWDLNTGWSLPSDMHFSFRESFEKYADAGVRLSDINGDGLIDIVKSGPSNSSTWGYDKTVIHDGEVPNLLKTINHSEGGSTEITYKPSTQYTDANGDLLNPDLPFVINTVESVTKKDGIGSEYSTTYTYEGGHLYFNDPHDKKFAGFAIVTEETDTKITKSYFHQGNWDWVYFGESADHIAKADKPYLVEIYDTSDNLYQQTNTTWGRYNLGTNSDWVRKIQEITRNYDGNGDNRAVAVQYEYDIYGNMRWEKHLGEVTSTASSTYIDIPGDTRLIARNYTNDTDNYIIGLLVEETIYDNSTSTILSSVTNYYDGLHQYYASSTKGNLTQQVKRVADSVFVSTEYTYNSEGLVTEEDDPLDNQTGYTYDTHNLYPVTVTSPTGTYTHYTYDYSSGKVLTTKDPNGHTFGTKYDGLDRPIEEYGPSPDGTSSLETFADITYTDSGTSSKVTREDHLSLTNSRISVSYLDGFGRVIQTRAESGESGDYVVQDTIYNEQGLVGTTSLPYFAGGQTKTAPTTTPELLTTLAYDTLDRPLQTETALGITVNEYDQFIATTTDPQGNVKTIEKDVYGNLVKVIENNDGAEYVTKYDYDLLGNLTKITDANDNVRNFTYDNLSRRLVAEDLHDPSDTEYGSWTYAYDAAGNLTTKVSPNGATTTYTYDDLNRVVTEDNTTTAGVDVQYGYDNGDNGEGRLTSATSSGAVVVYEYNAHGAIANEKTTIDSTDYDLAYDYNFQGGQTEIIYPDDAEVIYTYDTAGMLDEVKYKESSTTTYTTLWEEAIYAPHGSLEYAEYGDGTRETRYFDPEQLYREGYKKTEFIGTSTVASAPQSQWFAFLESITPTAHAEKAKKTRKDLAHFRATAKQKLDQLKAGNHPENIVQKQLNRQEGDKLSRLNKEIKQPKRVEKVKKQKISKEHKAFNDKMKRENAKFSKKKAKQPEMDAKERREFEKFMRDMQRAYEEKHGSKPRRPGFDKSTVNLIEIVDEGEVKQTPKVEQPVLEILPEEATTTPEVVETPTTTTTPERTEEDTATTTESEELHENTKATTTEEVVEQEEPTATTSVEEVVEDTPEETDITEEIEEEQPTEESATSTIVAWFKSLMTTVRTTVARLWNAATAFASNNNMVQNPSLEATSTSQYTSWVATTTSTIVRTDTESSDGSYSLKIDNTSEEDSWDTAVIQILTIEPDKTYRFSFDAKASASTTFVSTVGMEHSPYADYGHHKVHTASTSWDSFSVTFDSDATTTDPLSSIHFGFGENIATFYIDNIVLEEVAPSNEIIDNRSFEENTSGWSGWATYQTSDFGRTDTESSQGEYSYWLALSQAADENWKGQLSYLSIEIATGTDYVLTFDAKATSSREIYAVLAQNHTPWANLSNAATTTIGTSWDTYTFNFTATAGDTNGRVAFNYGLDGTDFFIDNVSLATTTSGSSGGSGGNDPLDNPSFEDGQDPWTQWSQHATGSHGVDCNDGSDGNCSFLIELSQDGTANWQGQLSYPGLEFATSGVYTVVFDAKADAEREVTALLEQTLSPYTQLSGAATFDVKTNWNTYVVQFTSSGSETNGRLSFHFGLDDTTFRIDNVAFYDGAVDIKRNPVFADVLQEYIYTYDTIGNITQIADVSETMSAYNANYVYDDLYRLVGVNEVTSGATTSVRKYSYDALGNMLVHWNAENGTSTYVYNHDTAGHYENPHAVSVHGGNTYTYDTNGNVLTDGTRSNTWNYKNQLTQTVAGGATTTYDYNHAGIRVKKSDGTNTTHYVGSMYDAKGPTTTKHIYANGILIASVTNTGASAELKYKHLDHLGSTRVVTNTDGMIEQVMDYQPFGQERVNENYALLETRHSYTGHEKDSESGLVYMQARYQNPEVMRFMSQDPAFHAVGTPALEQIIKAEQLEYLIDPQTHNAYSYAANSPIVYYDPTGEWIKEWWEGEQSTEDFVVEIGDAANYLHDNSSTWGYLLDNPEKPAEAGLLFYPGGRIVKGLYDATKKANAAYQIAINGGKHAGLIRNYANRSIREIDKSIRTLNRRIEIHKDKISNPANYRKGWEDFSSKRKDSIINHWKDEIQTFSEKIDVLKGIINNK